MAEELLIDTRVCWDPTRLKEIDEAKKMVGRTPANIIASATFSIPNSNLSQWGSG